MVAVNSDISDLKEKEGEILQRNEEIIQQQEELQTILDDLSQKNILIQKNNKKLEKLSIVASETDNAIIIMDNEGEFQWVNKAFIKRTGLNLEELISQKGNNIFKTNNYSDIIKSSMDIVLKQKISTTFKKEEKNKEGEQIYSQITLTLIFNPDKSIKNIVSIKSDITELIKYEQEITSQKEEIIASINYAKKIQKAVLPSKELADKILNEQFVFFKPRDIVSGDFYWIKQIMNFSIVVTADCTGHGVPGAFLSMLGSSFLNEIVTKQRLDNPGEMQDKLRNKIKKSLNQTGQKREQKDGMDMSLYIVDNETRELQFSGAYNPIYIVREENNDKELIQLSADRQPIGIYTKETKFSTQKFQLQENDCVYSFTDGFADQFGGNSGFTKYKSKRFKELLLKVSSKSMIEQKEILDKEFYEWKGNTGQLDDILVIGVRVTS